MLSGSDLDEVVTAVATWYRTTKLEMIRAFERDHPYGSVRLTPAEQLSAYLSMTPEDWQTKMDQLGRRFRGFPNKAKLVEEELTHYIARMETLRSKLTGVISVPIS